jgi:hypothetical protein
VFIETGQHCFTIGAWFAFALPTLLTLSDVKRKTKLKISGDSQMTHINSFKLTTIAAMFFAFAGVVVAQGPVIGSTTTTSELSMTANVETALQLNISTGSGGATVNGSAATGLFSVNFGNVNALGAGSAAPGVTVVTNGSGALYKTPVNLTPVFSGFTTETALIEVEQDAGGDTGMAREGNSSIGFGSTVSTSTPAAVASGLESDTPIERWVGMYVSKSEAGGAKTATLIYTITVQND